MRHKILIRIQGARTSHFGSRYHCIALTALLLAHWASGQTSHFLFESTGNLLAQKSETAGLPLILGQPQNQIVIPGDSASFSVVAADTRGLSYQWRFNGSDLPGQTSDALLLTNVSAANEGVFSVFLSNRSGSVLSDPAFLYIDSNGNGLPDSWEIEHFGNLGQTATGDFDGDGVSNLQEFLDGTLPNDASSVLYRLTLINNGGTVIVSPNTSVYTNGETVTLTAIASGAEPFHAWTGDVLSRSNPVTVTMNANKTLVANFAPVSFVWTNINSGDWNVAANWSPNLVPGSNDSVVILVSAAVALDTDADCADVSLGGAGISPTLTGSGTLTVRGTLLWSSGTFSGSGRTIVETAGVCWMDAPPAPSAALSLLRKLELAGTAVWTGTGDLNLTGGVISNRSGALFDVQGSGSFNLVGAGSARLDNAGVFRKSTSNSTGLNGVSFNNYNVAQIQSGTLVLGGGGTNSGNLSVGAGATLNMASGTFISDPGSTIAGGGQFIFSGGTANLTGEWLGTNNTFVFSGGTGNFDGTGTVAPSVINLDSGALGGAQTVTVGSVMNWTGGAMSGPGRTVIPPGITLNAAIPSFASMTSRTLEIGGTMIWMGPGSISMNDAVITNRPGALLDIQNASAVNFGGGSPRWDNAGTFRKSISAGQTAFNNVGFNNYNDIEIQAGTLSLLGGGLNNGTINVPAGTALDLGGAFGSSTGSSITGAGQLTATFGTVTLAGLVNVTGSNIFANGTANLTGGYFCTNNTMTISGGTANFDGTGIVAPSVLNLNGTLGGAQTVKVGGSLNWTGGSMTGSGRTVILPAASFNVGGPTFLQITSRTLENAGTAVWTGAGNIFLNDAVITNRPGGLFNPQNSAGIFFNGGAPRFDNAGTFRKSANTGTTTVSGFPFNNYGVVELQSGILSSFGGYFSASNALLSSTLGGTNAGTNFGQLQVSGAVTFNGGLGVSLANSFSPALNDSFAIVTAGSRSGAFTSFLYPSNMVTMQLNNTTDAVVVVVTGVANPAPQLLLPQVSGTNVTLSWTAVPNLTYRLEFNPNLTPSNWNALVGDVTSVSNLASKVDSLTPTNRFYRVRLVP